MDLGKHVKTHSVASHSAGALLPGLLYGAHALLANRGCHDVLCLLEGQVRLLYQLPYFIYGVFYLSIVCTSHLDISLVRPPITDRHHGDQHLLYCIEEIWIARCLECQTGVCGHHGKTEK